MFFVNGNRLIIANAAEHPLYERYNQLSKGITASKVGQVISSSFYRKYETGIFPDDVKLTFSLWRLVDENIGADERGVDVYNNFTVTLPYGKRISYAVVPRMSTDRSDKYPCEWTSEKEELFEDMNDPRVVLIARAYRGIIAEIAKDFVLKYEAPFQNEYTSQCWSFSSIESRNKFTEEALKLLKPNAVLP